MTSAPSILDQLFNALALPASAVMERRVPKAMLAEHGAASAGDRKLVATGIERLRWRAILKPATIGVPALTDEARDYREIAVLTLEVRNDANAKQLAKIAHAAIPYPLILIIGDEKEAALSLAPKRRYERKADRFVAERLVNSPSVTAPHDGVVDAFLASLAIAQTAAVNLCSLYEGMIHRAEAYAAARITGAFRVSGNAGEAASRRSALAIYADQRRILAGLRRQMKAETRLSNRLRLSNEITIVESMMIQTITAL